MSKRTTFALVTTLLVLAGISFLAYRWANRPRTGASTGVANSATTTPPAGIAAAGTTRLTDVAPMPPSASPAVSQVNPYAVVRQGICVPSNAPHQKEASRKKWEALLRDPRWQSIYPGVNPEKFNLVKTSLPLHSYVTYWKMENGQAIHWTGRKILIPAGTRVFTDGRGTTYLCACGNQVAAVLPQKVSGTVLPPEEEPPVAYLVPPDTELLTEIPQQLPGETPTSMTPLEVAPPPLYNESRLIPPATTIPPTVLGHSPPPDGGPGLTPVPPGEPQAVPEPDTLSLLLIGLGTFIVASRRRRR